MSYGISYIGWLSHTLLGPILLPGVGGLLCLLLPRRWGRLAMGLAIAVSLATALLVWPLFSGGPQTLEWAPGFLLKLDKLNGFILLVSCCFSVVLALYSWGFFREQAIQRTYSAYFLLTLSSAAGVLLANDLILLLVFWGFLGFTLYMMVGFGGDGAATAAKKTFVIIGASDSLLLLGIALVWLLTQSTRMDSAPIVLSDARAATAFVLFAVAALAKAGAMPFHTWVPDCGEHAPIPVSAFLPAGLDKLLGIYLLVRVAYTLFILNSAMLIALSAVGAATIVLAVMMALIQHDLKRLLSYHAVSQVGYMVLGIGTGLPLGIAAGLFHMLNHVLYKSCLFLCAGAVQTRAHTTDMDKLGGLARAMPITFWTCLIAALSISGIPPLNGFASKWMIYQAILESAPAGGWLWIVWLAAALAGSALTLASFVKVLHAVFLGQPSPGLAAKSIREVGWSMTVPMLVLAGACLLFGIFAFPLPLSGLIFPAVPGLVTFSGVWWAGTATWMLAAGIGLGLLLYALSSKGKMREVPTYIGGEILEAGVQVTGVDFYLTIRDLPWLSRVYRLAEKKVFDIYHVATVLIFKLAEGLSAVHTGRLPWFLTWVLAGLLILIVLLRSRVS